MSEAFEIMKWPMLACLLLPGLLVYLGLHVVRREIIFVDLALAQVATLGTCVCLYLGHEAGDPHNYYWSVGFTLAGALVFTFTRFAPKGRVPQEALIGIVYVVTAAAGILLLSKSPHGKEELQKTLVGDLLTVDGKQVLQTFLLFAAVGAVHVIFRHRFIPLSFDPEHERTAGISLHLWDFIFYALFGIVVTSFVQIGGVLLVFTYLIVPAVCANFLATSLMVRLGLGWAVATLASGLGLYLSYRWDVPTGAAVVCAFGMALVLVAAGSRLRKRRPTAPEGSPER